MHFIFANQNWLCLGKISCIMLCPHTCTLKKEEERKKLAFHLADSFRIQIFLIIRLRSSASQESPVRSLEFPSYQNLTKGAPPEHGR